MKNYIFKTTTTMKEYNSKKWWIDGNCVTEKRIAAENITAALEKYREAVEEDHYITISRNALKNKNPMYVDTITGETKQIGFVITGSCDFEDRNNYKWSKQYIDLWVSVLTVIDTDFEEVTA